MIVSAIFLIDFKHVIIVSMFVLIQTSNELLMLYWGICELPATVWAVPPSELSAGLRDVWVSLWCCAGRHTGTQHNTVMSSPCFLFIFRNCYNYLIIFTIIIIIIVYSQCLCLSAPSRVGPMFSFGRRSELAHSESRSINDDFKMFQGYKNYIETIQILGLV